MTLQRLRYLPSFSVGIDEIDEDHQRLIDLSNRIADSIEAGDYPTCDVLFQAFMDECRGHFDREEVHLYATGFPEARSHAAQHQELLDRADAAQIYCREKILNAQAGDCYARLIDFLVADILRADIRFKSFLEEQRGIRG
jgi:hemerythrin